MATAAQQNAGHIVLTNVAWSTYEALLADSDSPGTRFTYDRGTLEIMSPSEEHERCKKFLARMIETLTEELRIPIRSAGSTTWRREAARQGLEPDECYYISNEPQVRGRRQLDLSVDPAPDLVVEVEITAPSVDKMPIYAGLGVAEVWRYDGKHLRIERLQDDGTYAHVENSTELPMIPPGELERFLDRRDKTDETTWIRSFRAWVATVLDSP
ncbi:MAG TPA: Uma2 family endonuclease [Thermoguttaceae bacterium]|nr:Uma2 family endonuclease [Thermoguttaceae bacterium]